MSEKAERREQLEEIAAALDPLAPVEIGTMFGSPGIRTDGKVVAFIAHDERLVVKLPRERALALIAEGSVEPMVMGGRTMKEWVGIPVSNDAAETFETRVAYTQESLVYVRSLLG